MSTSTRPYFLRAIYEWCTDNGCTPYIVVKVDASVKVPMDYVSDGKIVLNVSFDATSGLHISNEVVEFKARFGGKSCEIVVPVDHVLAIYARENGEGMAFPEPDDEPSQNELVSVSSPSVATTPSSHVEQSASSVSDRHIQLVTAEDAVHRTTDVDIEPQHNPKPTVTTSKKSKATLTRIK